MPTAWRGHESLIDFICLMMLGRLPWLFRPHAHAKPWARRVIYRIDSQMNRALVLSIAHRREVYE
jgi:hypothetical protein